MRQRRDHDVAAQQVREIAARQRRPRRPSRRCSTRTPARRPTRAGTSAHQPPLARREPPVPLAEQAQRGRGQRGQVSSADRAVPRYRHRQSRVDPGQQRPEHARIDPRPPAAIWLARTTSIARLSSAAIIGPLPPRVATQQPVPVPGPVPRVHGLIPVGANPCRPAVYLPGGGHLRGGRGRRPGPFDALIRHDGRRGPRATSRTCAQDNADRRAARPAWPRRRRSQRQARRIQQCSPSRTMSVRRISAASATRSKARCPGWIYAATDHPASASLAVRLRAASWA